jgi:predicted RNA-binding protein
MGTVRYWVIVASKDHVQRGVSGGFCQANHGKAAPLERMKPGDWVLFYSPKVAYTGKDRLQAFTAIGTVKANPVYQVEMGDDFTPYRRDVDFHECQETPIRPLIPQLSFIENKQRWGYVFRFGFFEIPEADFDLIAGEMLDDERKASIGG